MATHGGQIFAVVPGDAGGSNVARVDALPRDCELMGGYRWTPSILLKVARLVGADSPLLAPPDQAAHVLDDVVWGGGPVPSVAAHKRGG